MASLTPLQVAQLAYNAGLRNVNDVATATAIARRESGFNPRAHNPKPPDNSYGLWQINMLGALGPDRRKKLGLANNEALFDPATNARAMVQIYREAKGWKPWSTYRGLVIGAEDRNAANAVVMGGGNAPGGIIDPAAVPITGTPVGLLDAGVGAIQAMVDFVKFVTDPGNWIRLIAFSVGGVLFLFGLIELIGIGGDVRGIVKGGFNAVIGSKTGGLVQA